MEGAPGASGVTHARERFPTTDWRRWTFTAEEFGFGCQLVIRFTIDPAGESIRLP